MARFVRSPDNATLKHVRKLFRDSSYRRRCGEFVIEGYRIFDSASRVVTVLLREDAEPPRFDLGGIDVVRLSAKLYDTLSDDGPGQGVSAVCRLPPAAVITAGGCYIYLDGLQDPGNTGTILRTAAAFRLDGVLFGENCADPFSPKVVRSSAGGIFKIPIMRPVPCEELRGRRILAADLGGRPVREAGIRKDFVLVIGNEGAGLSPGIEALSPEKYSIPMPGGTESLNAAVAAAIMLYELTGQGRLDP